VLGIAPLPWLRRWPRWLGALVVAVATVASLGWSLQQCLPPGVSVLGFIGQSAWWELRAALRAAPGVDGVFYWHGLFVLALATFIVAIRASGAVSGEREQVTWASLLLTPLPTRTIVRGLHWGIFLSLVPYLAAYAVAALACSLFVGVSAAAWTILWLAATVLAAQFAGAVGIWCSVRTNNSWLSLLTTLAWCYVSWIAFAVPIVVAAYFIKAMVEFFLAIANAFDDISGLIAVVQGYEPAQLALGVGLILGFVLVTRHLLVAAAAGIDQRDRAKEVDPQFHRLQRRWLRRLELRRRAPEGEAAIEQPLPLHE
jgi:hypothetical protein